jgi:hypothetical protein
MCHPPALADVKECCIAQGVWPECKVHCPGSTSVKQLLLCTLREVADGLLGDAILKVSIYATEGKVLVLFMAGLFEYVVRKLPVVAMVLLNFYAVLGGKGLKGAFGGNGLDG